MKIFLENTECSITGADAWTLEGLREELSYTDDSAEYAYSKTMRDIGRYTALLKKELDPKILVSYTKMLNKLNYMADTHDRNRKIYLMDSEHNKFPSGLLNKALDWLDDQKIYWEIVDKRKTPIPLDTLKLIKDFPTLRYYQEEALEKAMAAGRGIIVAATGVGKSILFSAISRDIRVKTLIITPNKEITQNAHDTLVEFFGEDKVKRLNTKSTSVGRISVCNIQTLINLDPELFKDVTCCIIDEFHRSGAISYLEVSKKHLKNCYYRFGLTATAYRNGGDGLALEAILSDVLYNYSSKQAIEEGYLTKPKFKWVRNTMNIRGKYQSQYKLGIVENQDRNSRIVNICKEHSNDFVLVLVQQVKHGELLKEMLPTASLISGREKDADRAKMLQDFREGKINILIGTSVIGEGVDLPIANVIVLAGGGKARSQVVQNVGRVLRLYEGKKEALIYDFKDEGAHYLESHAEERMTIYQDNYPLT